jgi:hypothetical protein
MQGPTPAAASPLRIIVHRLTLICWAPMFTWATGRPEKVPDDGQGGDRGQIPPVSVVEPSLLVLTLGGTEPVQVLGVDGLVQRAR